ncbi:MAG TPA: peroxiredoxin [Candidatus Paceibacterota bacterium]|nr:peroxiredoxin [Candidatus Paceibacterota bacterium]
MDEDILHAGAGAPDFTLPDQDGKPHTLSDYRGRWILLYFYVKDDTFGCTKEACGFRDHFHSFDRMNVAIIGVSQDSVESHKRFVLKYALPFPLLSDIHRKVAAQYGLFAKQSFLGNGDEVTPTSFLINIAGGIEKIYRNIRPEIHAKEVLADLFTMQQEDQAAIDL